MMQGAAGAALTPRGLTSAIDVGQASLHVAPSMGERPGKVFVPSVRFCRGHAERSAPFAQIHGTGTLANVSGTASTTRR